MKKFSIVATMIAAIAFVSCQKQQTEDEKNAEVERRVQERLAAEQQTQQQQQLEQRQADLEAREKALAEKESATAAATPAQTSEQSETTLESRPRAVEPREPRESSMSVGYSTFYNKLGSYGDWIETGDYGYVFHPREAQSSRWRPYTDGRWVYTDAGWTWISEEPFGWATYHYGRWTRLHGIGWVWVPGNQWAPAWVSWRKSPDYVGWAPLPPEARFDRHTGIHNWSDNYYDVGPDQYCFVASREFGAARVQQTLLPPERSVTIVNQTTNVTNITYNNTTIVNEGPSYDELRSISREPVQRYRLERNTNVDLAGGASRPEMRGETVVVAAPVIAQPAANERPRTVKQTIATATVDLGWAAIGNQEEAKRTRQKMKAEATPPPNPPPKKFVKAESAAAGTSQPAQTSSPISTSASATVAPTAAAMMTPSSTTPATPTHTITPRPAATAAAATTPASTTPATPTHTITPRHTATVAPTSAATAVSSPPTSPTPSQRRGRLLVPNASPTPMPQSKASAVMTPAPTTPIRVPSISPSATIGASPKGGPKGKAFKVPKESASIAPSPTPVKQFTPRAAAPTRSPSPSPIAKSTSSPEMSAAVTSSPAEKMTKQEKKEQKREERKEMKRERREGGAVTSPSPTP